jgi:hypothetical protein
VVTSFDVRAINATPFDVAIITFHYAGPDGVLPTVTYFDPSTQTMVPVDSSLFRVNLAAHTVTLRLDGSSVPQLVLTRGTVFSIAVSLPQLAPAALDPSLTSVSESAMGGGVQAVAATEGGQGGGPSAAVTGGSSASSSGSASSGGGGAAPDARGGAQDSTVLNDLPPAPPLVPSAVGTIAIPTIEPPPTAGPARGDHPMSEEEETTALPIAECLLQIAKAKTGEQAEGASSSEALPAESDPLPCAPDTLPSASGPLPAESDPLPSGSGNRQSKICNLQSAIPGDAELLLAAATFLARYGPDGERSLRRAGRRRGRT